MSIARTDNSTLGRWWWTVDRWTLLALMVLAIIGVVLAMAASPPVAQRIGLDSLHFVRRQAAYLPVALFVMVGVSLLSPVGARRLATTRRRRLALVPHPAAREAILRRARKA